MQDYIQGALFGCAIGDALGMPFEGQAPNIWSGTFEDSHSRHTRGLTRGKYTDDTQFTIATLESICDTGHVDIKDIAQRFAHIYATNQLRGGGRHTQEALKRVLRGEHATGTPNAHGCGAAMRTGLLAFLPYNGRTLEQVVIDAAHITHYSLVAVASSMAMTFGTAYTSCEKNPLATADAQHTFIDHLASVSRYDCPPEFDFPARVLILHDMLDLNTPTVGKEIGNSGLATESVILALHAYITNPRDFEACMRASIESGGDTDSIAAMAGTLYGAHHGFNKLPNKYKINIENANGLRELSKRYATLVTQDNAQA